MSDVATMEKANGRLAKTEDFDLDLIKRTVAKGATDDELALYLHDCQRRGVHPLDRMLHFTIREDHKTKQRRYTPIVSIDLFRSRAATTGEYAGSDDPEHVTEDGTEYPKQSTVTVYRMVQRQRCPFTATARWREYRPTTNDFMWQKMPYTMLGKCAEALALRKAFPAELGGLYTDDEMAQAGPTIDPDMTLEANSLSPQEQLKARQANPQARKVYCTQQQQDALRDIADEAGLSGDERIEILRKYGVKRSNSLTPDNCNEAVLEVCRRRVKQLLTELQFNLDDVRQEAPSVTADTPDELDQEQANAALTLLREIKRRQEGK